MTSVDRSDKPRFDTHMKAHAQTTMTDDQGGIPRDRTPRDQPTQDTDPALVDITKGQDQAPPVERASKHHSHSKHRREGSTSGKHTAHRPTPTRHRADRKQHQQNGAPAERPLPRPRRLSQTEVVFPSTEAAKQAFDADRTKYRRAPTPYISNRPLPSRPSTTSLKSLRSKVSFDSGRGRASADADDSDADSDGTLQGELIGQHPQHADSTTGTLGPWEPGFGATQGVGPAGEAIEYIGLGRKTPRHRTFQREMLKPALRSRGASVPYIQGRGYSDLDNRPVPFQAVPGPDGSFDSYRHPHDQTRMGGGRRGLSRHMSDMPNVGGYERHIQRPHGLSRSQSRSSVQHASRSSLKSFFSSLTFDEPPFGGPKHRSHPDMRGRNGRRQPPPEEDLLLHPAENLHFYLATAHVPAWRDWPISTAATSNSRGPASSSGPGSTGVSSVLGGLGPWGPLGGLGSIGKWLGGGKKGFGDMSWEWSRRFQIAEGERMNRAMRGWEGADRFWLRRILEWCDNNVPSEEIAPENRWGKQIFALPAEEFDTLEYFDDQAVQSGDHGLLSWLTKSVLQTATSAMHMLRFSSQPFTFHVLPSPRPPHTAFSPFSRDPVGPSAAASAGPCLWEGFGTLALVSKADETDRAMVLEVRPPDVLDSAVIREFAKGRREWWHLHGELCLGDVGQANLLQAQVYDDCVQNQVYFFAVTNLKQWVFGVFDASYTVAHVSPVIERKDREPSLLQCMVSWMVRAVDERPRAGDGAVVPLRASVESMGSSAAPPYSQPRKGRHRSDSDALHHQQPPYAQHNLPPQPMHQHHFSDFGPAMHQPMGSGAGFNTYHGPSPDQAHGMGMFGGQPYQYNGAGGGSMSGNHGLPGYFDVPPMSGGPAVGGYPAWTGQHGFNGQPGGMSGNNGFVNGMGGSSWYGGGAANGWSTMR